MEDRDRIHIEELSATISHSIQSDIVAVVQALSRSTNAGLRLAVSENLQTSFVLSQGGSTDSYENLGRWWIGLSRLLLDLFVPNIPIDPAALQRCSEQFWSAEKSRYDAQITMLRDFVERTQGTLTNGTIRYLETRAKDASAALPAASIQSPISRMDLSRLHSYWAEVQQFMSQVLSQAKVSIFVTDTSSRDSSAFMRENVTQASITAFCQRLDSVYPDFHDINFPLQTALYAMKLGVRLGTAAATGKSKPTTSMLGGIIAFPSICSAESLQDLSADGDPASTFATVLLRLTAVSCEVALGGEIHLYLDRLGELYEQVYGLWSINRSREEEKAREAQSLYRNQHVQDDPTDAEHEEQDFLTIFPEFEDLLDENDASVGSSRTKSVDLITVASMSSLMQAHQELFVASQLSLVSVMTRFERERRVIASTFVQTSFAQLEEGLDALSLPFQMRFINDELGSLRCIPTAQARSYDFYHDENIPEIRKAIDLIDSLVNRVDFLLNQWPDQMVLQHLKSRCEAVMKLSFRSPVAKVLSAIEQLLFNIEDWEMYANRDNSLRTQQQVMIALIVSWRRLELSAWQGLLDRQAVEFASATSEWWFRLYDATIRGVIHMADVDLEEAQSMADLTNFLENLVPLLDEFMKSSNLGQFAARLTLLRSMETHTGYLATRAEEVRASRLHRLHRVLHATQRYYSQFSAKVSESLESQRSVLEKEIRGFIKLASWKDINIHALRQSAQKTHRQLYKIVRKFRDVLRQPASPLLVWSSTNSPSKQSLPRSDVLAPSTATALPSSSVSSGNAAHLLNLLRTYQNFTTLVQRRIPESLSNYDSLSVESLAHDILTTSQTLSKEVIPGNIDPTRRSKLQKNLLTRKRKAWSDFMKELKRAGIPASVKAEVLQQHTSQSWVREQAVFVASRQSLPTIARADEYLHRLFSEMPDLRASL